MNELSELQAKQLVSKACWKIGVSPNLVHQRLISKKDFQDIQNKFINYEIIHDYILRWVEMGKPNQLKIMDSY